MNFVFERPDIIVYRCKSKPCVLFGKDRMPPFCLWLLFLVMKYDKTKVYLRLIYSRLCHNNEYAPNLNRGIPKSRLMSCKRPESIAKLAPVQLQFNFDIYKAEVLVFRLNNNLEFIQNEPST